MSGESKLTPEACRAGRALLRWSVANLCEKAGVSPNTVTKLENGGVVRAESASRLVAAFKKARVEITNGDGTGARLLRSK